MSYRFTEILFRLRKVGRAESRKGDLRKMVISALLAQSLVFLYFQVPFFSATDQLFLQKTLYLLRGEVQPPENLVIVNIDDKTFNQLGLSSKKPVPRSLLADALLKIQLDKPKIVLLDLFLSNMPEEAEATKKISEAMKLGPVTFAKAIYDSGSDIKGEVIPADPLIENASSKQIEMTVNTRDQFRYYETISLISKGASSKHKEANEIENKRIPIIIPLRKHVDSNIKEPAIQNQINYYGGAGKIKNISLYQLVSQKDAIPKGYFKDKIVFYGFNTEMIQRGTSDKEVFNIPLPEKFSNGKMYGVEIQATIAANLMQGSWIKTLDKLSQTLLLALLFCIINICILLLEPKNALIFLIGILSLWMTSTYIAFTYFNYFIPGFFMILFTSPFIFGGSSCVIATQALKELKETKKMLGMKEKLG